ncbi:hypothetical protein SAMN05216419_100855 [Nitrosomonas cryotolerans]|uniref:transposase n=1 Tax=Nitrosomonas cryotolerans TaxID=44575 RepID=UPI0008E4B431|nr:hypothetical protein SAMN05216419_100855 [Nitrosomonas cryotolerans]
MYSIGSSNGKFGFITQGTTADCTQVDRLIKELDADYLLADRGYDSNAIIEQTRR